MSRRVTEIENRLAALEREAGLSDDWSVSIMHRAVDADGETIDTDEHERVVCDGRVSITHVSRPEEAIDGE